MVDAANTGRWYSAGELCGDVQSLACEFRTTSLRAPLLYRTSPPWHAVTKVSQKFWPEHTRCTCTLPLDSLTYRSFSAYQAQVVTSITDHRSPWRRPCTMSAVQATGSILAIAAIMLASTCTAYGSVLPESTSADAAGMTPAEVSCHIKQCSL